VSDAYLALLADLIGEFEECDSPLGVGGGAACLAPGTSPVPCSPHLFRQLPLNKLHRRHVSNLPMAELQHLGSWVQIRRKISCPISKSGEVILEIFKNFVQLLARF
jgi:hypothetical protein